MRAAGRIARWRAGAAAVAGMAWAVRGRSSTVFGPSVWRGRPGRKAIALTFDDGPSPGTAEILDILAEYGVPATFFQCGENVLRAPELSRAVICAGRPRNRQPFSHAPEFRAEASAVYRG